ncbi:DUF58 domain-containing protein [candidate division WOR-3 bacterium]|nr:DUF58 domain-containing protein [candidate division WOR-3 bacterium]
MEKKVTTNHLGIPEYLLKETSLNIVAKMVVEGLFSGLHRSSYKGFSVEFSQHRKYCQGDDAKRIDWRATCRRDKTVIKEFEDRTNLQAYVVLDASASMDYGSNWIQKSEYAKILCASIIYLLTRQRDMVGFVSFTDKIDKIVLPGATGLHVRRLFGIIERTEFSGETSVHKTLFELGERIKKRSMIIIVSDLLGESREFMKPLKGLRYKKNEVVVFWVRDPKEIRYGFKEDLTFLDPENKLKRVNTEHSKTKKSYDDRMKGFEDFLFEETRKNSIFFIDARTDTDIGDLLLRFVAKRSKIL